jgi:DNA-binding transcriptional MocR family regulator
VLSERQLAARMGCTRKTARKAVHELVEKGFVEPRVKGAFSVKFRRATEWRLNDRRCDATGTEQSQAFLKWQRPTPGGQTTSKPRGKGLPLYTGKKHPTRNFPTPQEREQILPHSEEIRGGENYPTSISTSITAFSGATVVMEKAACRPADRAATGCVD